MVKRKGKKVYIKIEENLELTDEEIKKDRKFAEFLKSDYYLWHGFMLPEDIKKKMDKLAKNPKYQKNGVPVASKIGLAVFPEKSPGGAKIAGTSYFKYKAMEKELIEKFRKKFKIRKKLEKKSAQETPSPKIVAAAGTKIIDHTKDSFSGIENPYQSGEYLKYREMYLTFVMKGEITATVEEIERLKEGIPYFLSRPGEPKIKYEERRIGEMARLKIIERI